MAEKPSSTPSLRSATDVASAEVLADEKSTQEPYTNHQDETAADNVAPAVALGEGTVAEKNPIEGKDEEVSSTEEPEYPTGIKLLLISLALCLSVFLVALVGTPSPKYLPCNAC